jgi:hypothetical protein
MKKTTAKRPRQPAINCPHCGGRAIVRHSIPETNLSRELRFRCDDDSCGHTFVAQLVIIRTLVPSARPNPEVHLPLCNPRLQHFKNPPANDDHREPANDAEAPTPAAAGSPPMTG